MRVQDSTGVSVPHVTLPIINCVTQLYCVIISVQNDRIICNWTAPVSSCYYFEWIQCNKTKHVRWRELHVKDGPTSKGAISNTTAVTTPGNNFGPVHNFQSRNLLQCHLLTGKRVHLIWYYLLSSLWSNSWLLLTLTDRTWLKIYYFWLYARKWQNSTKQHIQYSCARIRLSKHRMYEYTALILYFNRQNELTASTLGSTRKVFKFHKYFFQA